MKNKKRVYKLKDTVEQKSKTLRKFGQKSAKAMDVQLYIHHSYNN